MKNDKININQTVAILCDGNNVERSIQSLTQSNSMLNFDSVIPRILNGRSLNRLIYFREGRNISSKLADRLHENFFGSVVPCHKSADIPLSIKATQLASKVDTIVILSGDSDYVDLVRHLKSEGVRVEIVAVKENAARILLEEADFFHPITRADSFEYNKPKQYQRSDRGEQGSGNKTVDSQPTAREQQTQTEQSADTQKTASRTPTQEDKSKKTGKDPQPTSDNRPVIDSRTSTMEKYQGHLDMIKDKLTGLSGKKEEKQADKKNKENKPSKTTKKATKSKQNTDKKKTSKKKTSIGPKK